MSLYQSPFCDMCTRRRIIPGTGPLPCKWLFLGEGGGWEENKYLQPFVGKSGRELNGLYFPMSGLSRPEVRIENAMQCFHEDPDQEHVDCCSQKFLQDIIANCRPEVIVTLGAMSLAQFGDWSLELEHGFPIYDVSYQLKWGETWTGTVFPCYHPAAGLHQSRFMTEIQEDFRNLWAFRHGKLRLPVDQFPNPTYQLVETRDHMRAILHPIRQQLRYQSYVWKFGIDTEYIGKRIFCWTFSPTPGTGYMVLADNQPVREEFLLFVEEFRALLLWIFQNWLADAPMLAQIGMTDYKWKDTMVNSYHLGSTPQGLKQMCYRLLGMVMQDFDDLVYPFAREEAIKWLVNVASNPDEDYISSLPWKAKSGSCSGGGDEVPGYPALDPTIKTYKKKPPERKYKKHLSCPAYFDEPGTLPCIICGKPKESGSMDRDKGGRQFMWDVANQIYLDMSGLNPKKNPSSINPFKRWAGWKEREPDLVAMTESRFGPIPKPTIDLAFRRDPQATIWYACRDADGTLRLEPNLNMMGKRVEKEIRKGETYAA